jgi:hypothetical protein
VAIPYKNEAWGSALALIYREMQEKRTATYHDDRKHDQGSLCCARRPDEDLTSGSEEKLSALCAHKSTRQRLEREVDERTMTPLNAEKGMRMLTGPYVSACHRGRYDEPRGHPSVS